jgi:DNA-binding response OmpR family regulator
MIARGAILIYGDAALQAALGEQLARQGEFTVLAAQDAAQAEARRRAGPPDILIVDGDRPDAATIAESGATRGVILIGGEETPGDARIRRLARPFRLARLLALVDALTPPPPPGCIGPYRFDRAAQSLIGAGDAIALTAKEAAILARLAENPEAPTPREILLREVWGYSPDVDSRTLETHIHRLRRKIETDPNSPRLLLTEAGGYRLAMERPPLEPPRSSDPHPLPADADAPPAIPPDRKRP